MYNSACRGPGGGGGPRAAEQHLCGACTNPKLKMKHTCSRVKAVISRTAFELKSAGCAVCSNSKLKEKHTCPRAKAEDTRNANHPIATGCSACSNPKLKARHTCSRAKPGDSLRAKNGRVQKTQKRQSPTEMFLDVLARESAECFKQIDSVEVQTTKAEHATVLRRRVCTTVEALPPSAPNLWEHVACKLQAEGLAMDAAVCTNIYIDDRSTQAFSNGTSPRGDAGSKTACTGPSVANASATPAADLTAGKI